MLIWIDFLHVMEKYVTFVAATFCYVSPPFSYRDAKLFLNCHAIYFHDNDILRKKLNAKSSICNLCIDKHYKAALT